jgi:hypothetical protein
MCLSGGKEISSDLLANANFLSFSSSKELKDLDSGQKNMRIPKGNSGKIKKKSLFQR